MTLKFGNHPNKILQQEWAEFKAENFEFSILSEIEYKDANVDYNKEIQILEELYLEELQPHEEKGYNKRKK